MTFDYQKYEVQPFPGQLNPGIVFRPVLELRLIGTRDQVPFWGLVDSGADMTVLPKSIAEFIGVAALSSSPGSALGAGGEIELAYGTVLLQIDFGKNVHRWCAIVGIAEETWTEVVLGHSGFLQFFDATFFREKHVLELKRNRRPFSAAHLPNP